MAHAKKSTIQIGMITIPIRLEVAVGKESSDRKTICTGDGTHEPTRVKNHVDCPTCGTSHSSSFGFPERGIERDGKLVVLTADELKEAAGEPIKNMALSFHPREKVYAATVAGDSVQNTYPDKGGEKAYTALRDTLLAHPEIVAVTVWAAGTANSLWVLEVVGQHIVASKRAWPEDVRPAPAIAPAEVTDMEAEMFNTFVQQSVTDFDILQYRDAARDGMDALVASRMGDAILAPATVSATAAPAGDMLAALQASLASLPDKPAAKKAAKKAPAKKAAPKEKVA